MSYKLRKLSILGDDVPAAEIIFRDGLNVITGPSNTGKTYIFQCLNYMLGSSKAPKSITESKKYRRIFLEIESHDNKILTLESDLQGGDFKLFELPLDHAAESLNYTHLKRSHDPDDESNVSVFLLKLNNLFGKEIRINAKGAKRGISYRDIVKFLLASETRIITDSSPITSGQWVTATAEENVFKFIISGEDDSAVVVTLNDKQIAHRKGKIELLTEFISKYEVELATYAISAGEVQQLNRLDDTISKLKKEQKELYSNFTELDKIRISVSSELTSARSTDVYFGEMLKRSKILDHQYKSDLERLNSTIETSKILTAEHTFDANCPLCKRQLKEKCDEQIILSVVISCEKEIIKINSLLAELILTCDLLIIEKDKAESEVQRLSLELEQISEKIQTVSERLSLCLQRLDEATAARTKVAQYTYLRSKRDDFYTQLSLLKIESKSKKSQFAGLTTSTLTGISNLIFNILKSCNYPGLTAVTFSEEKKDFVISGEDRELAGKGFRAITYSAFILAIQEFLNDKEYSLGTSVLDSPLVTYKKKEITEEDDLIPVDLAMDFYRYASRNKKIEQIIILENIAPPEDIESEIHHINFTQSKTKGRYGFFPL